MEFEELKKIWDKQNDKPMYIINEEALHKSILRTKRKANLTSEFNEIGLILIGVFCSIFIFYRHGTNAAIYPYLIAGTLSLTCLYVLFGRFRRKRNIRKFGNSVLDDLDHAIANTNYEIKRAKTFAWWYILPLSIPVYLNMYIKDVSVLTYLLITLGFAVSWYITRLGLTHSQIPKKKRLVNLRKKLTEEPQEPNDPVHL